jgi:hypothetical protein
MKNEDDYNYCKNNPKYFINKYVNLNSTYTNSPFKGVLYDYQEGLIDHYHENSFSVCKAPRQSGKTITSLAYMLHYNVFNKNKTSGIITYGPLENFRGKLKTLKNMYLALPEWFKGDGMAYCADNKLVFNNGSSISRIIGAEPHICSSFKQLDFLFLDEFAHIDQKIAKRIVDIIFTYLPEKVIAPSTPSYSKVCDIDEDGNITEKVNQFYELWMSNRFSSYSVHWYELPGSSEEKKKEIISNIGTMAWGTEYECQFKSITNYKSRPFHSKKPPKDELLLAGILLDGGVAAYYKEAIRERLGNLSDAELKDTLLTGKYPTPGS